MSWNPAKLEINLYTYLQRGRDSGKIKRIDSIESTRFLILENVRNLVQALALLHPTLEDCRVGSGEFSPES